MICKGAEPMPPILIAILALGAAAPAAPAQPAANEVAPVEVVAPRPSPARSHAQAVADRWSPKIITCRPVFVQNLGVLRRECATNRAWEIEHQRIRHEFMQEQWRMMQ
jgi:hypothetical protein